MSSNLRPRPAATEEPAQPSVRLCIPVEGPWQCRVVGEPHWRDVSVPGCWEHTGIAKNLSGPVDYRTTVVIPPGSGAKRWRLRFAAVSYACVVSIDGREAGRHIGMWDAFDVDVTALLRPGIPSELMVRVDKPASLTAGPDSPPVTGTYPMTETLAGFLPYIWGHAHGGIWQPVDLIGTGTATVESLATWGTADGRLRVRAQLSAPGEVTVTVTDPQGRPVARRSCHDRVDLDIQVPDPQPWSPHRPDRYTVRVHVADGDEVIRRTGLRTLTADGSLLRLNGDPLYSRMVLSWGWYPGQLYPDPGPQRVRADLTRLAELGFNGVKLCLWFPPEYYFDIADELGMLLWLELPMWLPRPTEHFRRQLFIESERLVGAAANHPSVILYTLGCELGSAVGADLLGPLYASVKRLAHDGLVRDNSGSGEAYGGLLDEFADFDDHHFYCEPEHFRSVLDHFAPRWRDRRPWLFGEFGDLDTFRDLDTMRQLDVPRHPRDAHHPASARDSLSTADGRPWWTSPDPAINPQGARWQYDVPAQAERIAATGYATRGAELTRISHQQAVLHRKLTLETVRARPDTSGYVITGERDTPISTAGLWDDLGRLKVDPQDFAQFNADLVVTLGWDRRRAWVAGGDRPAYVDAWCHPAGAIVRVHLVLAHHGREPGEATATWEVSHDGETDGNRTIAAGTERADVSPGTVRRIGIAEFRAPAVDQPLRVTLQVRVHCGRQTTANHWPLWFFPADPWTGAGALSLIDPAGRLSDLPELAPRVVKTPEQGAVAVATAWTRPLQQFISGGGAAILLIDRATVDPPVPVAAMPFWREAVKVIEPHEAWGDFPHDGWTNLQFTGIATDLAMDVTTLGAAARPLLRRVDARTTLVHDYATEVVGEGGRLLLTTLRPDGCLGDQPSGLRRNVAGEYLLSRWVRSLTGTPARSMFARPGK